MSPKETRIFELEAERDVLMAEVAELRARICNHPPALIEGLARERLREKVREAIAERDQAREMCVMYQNEKNLEAKICAKALADLEQQRVKATELSVALADMLFLVEEIGGFMWATQQERLRNARAVHGGF